MLFQYCSIKSLRDYGVSSNDISDALALKLIIDYSSLINQLTEQFFIPQTLIERISGGTKLIKIANKSIIKINSIYTISNEFIEELIETTNYRIDKNLIIFNIFTPEGIRNIKINGVFGNINNSKDISFTSTSNIIKDSTTFTVNDTTGLEENDVIVYGNYCIFINSINHQTKTITIDKFPYTFSINSGTQFNCYGSVNPLITKCILMLVKNYKSLQSQVGRIKSEKTDDYEYELFESFGNSTGIVEVDNILNSFINSQFNIEYL